ncbi:GTP-binding protein YchF [Phascolomyces articulosus]|uniref:Obg-like ATPase 1 n=1 Tax=Phascolomyces articulosus TaxID=60185 RepID=A0AAD5K1C8_9FUNG|nr:GTP-binding protein YchF [Phascolomyces articulosus]
MSTLLFTPRFRGSTIIRLCSNTPRLFSTSTVVCAKKSKRKSDAVASSSTEKAILGRPSNNLKMGVVGMPNIGKSSLFNALTSSSVPAENYPFCTIDPSESRVHVPDERFDWLCESYNPKKQTPAHLTVVDIAGLVRGAAQGAGLGNAFLSNVASVDAIYHLVRAFENDDITHVEDTVDPIRDLEIIQDELRLKDEEMLERYLTDIRRAAKFPDKKHMKEHLDVVEKVGNYVGQSNDVRKGDWTAAEVNIINSLHLLTAKPMIYLCNVGEDDYLQGGKNPWLPKIQKWVNDNNPGDIIIPLSVALESKLLNDMLPEEADAYLADHGVESQLSKVILAGYKSLQLIHYFTAGPDEVRAWTVRDTTKAPQAAGVIHTDFERGFISAEVMKYADLRALGGEAEVRSAGKYLAKGKDYSVEDGDIMYFKFNVTGKKK